MMDRLRLPRMDFCQLLAKAATISLLVLVVLASDLPKVAWAQQYRA
jgi:hypothetical protein